MRVVIHLKVWNLNEALRTLPTSLYSLSVAWKSTSIKTNCMNNTITGIVIVIVLAVMGVFILKGSSTVEYVAEEPEVITKEVTPDWAKDEEAVEAAQAVIRRKELEAEKAQLGSEVQERQNRLDEIDKQLGLF